LLLNPAAFFETGGCLTQQRRLVDPPSPAMGEVPQPVFSMDGDRTGDV